MPRVPLISAVGLGVAALTLILSTPAYADDQRTGERLRERLVERQAGERRGIFRRGRRGTETPPADLEFSYGDDPLQTIGFYHAQSDSEQARPLVIFVHGGGWRMGDRDNATGEYKSGHYTGLGYHFASINYRLVPDATVEQQARDVADAVKALLDRSASLKIDREHVVLMGHSAGAHLVSLVSTDPQYLAAAGLDLGDIAGTIPLDGAAYHVPEQMEGQRRFLANMYEGAFGDDPARQRTLSPTLHAAAPNVGNFLILYVQREDGTQQSRQFAAALEQAGSAVEHRQYRGRGLRGHAEINREMGNPDYPATADVDRWLAELFAS